MNAQLDADTRRGQTETLKIQQDLRDAKRQFTQWRHEGKGEHLRWLSRYVNPGERLTCFYNTHKPLNRAYFKLCEIYHRYTPPSAYQWRTLHLCEAPGAWVQATGHWWTRRWQQHQDDWKWNAITLYDPTIPWEYGDNIVYQDICRVPLPLWARDMNIVTGDGGFEIPHNKLELQETLNHDLFVAQVDQGIQACGRGGMVIIKLFDMFTAATQQKIAHFSRYFSTTHLIKPWGSRIANSERYIVGVEKREPLCYTLQQSENLQRQLDHIAVQWGQNQLTALQWINEHIDHTPTEIQDKMKHSDHHRIGEQVSRYFRF
jgi:hypothetical protein